MITPGGRNMKVTWWWVLGVILFGLYLVLLNIALIYVLVKIWPATIPLAAAEQEVALWKNVVVRLPLETRHLLIVAVTGALGSYIHLATSFADYVGNRWFVWSWGWWYLLRPFIGMALAVIMYFVVRGGLITGQGSAENLNLYGIAAISGLAGMFSKQATDKLREVFENLFKTAEEPVRVDKPTKQDQGDRQPPAHGGGQEGPAQGGNPGG